MGSKISPTSYSHSTPLRLPHHHLIRAKIAGFSLMEILGTITLIAALLSVAVPCWGALTRSRARQAATGIVMESLERARQSAITGKVSHWVIFRHRPGSRNDSLRTLSRQEGAITPLGGWQPLPAGVSFGTGTGTLMKEEPPKEILSAALGNQPAGTGETFGALMFQSSGRIGIPSAGGTPLALQLFSQIGGPVLTITLSRATGRSACK